MTDQLLIHHEEVIQRLSRFPKVASFYDARVLKRVWRDIECQARAGVSPGRVHYPELYLHLMNSPDLFLAHIDKALGVIRRKADRPARQNLTGQLESADAGGSVFEVQLIEMLAERFGEDAVTPYPKVVDRTNAPRLDCALVTGTERIGFEATQTKCPGPQPGPWSVTAADPLGGFRRALGEVQEKVGRGWGDWRVVVCVDFVGPVGGRRLTLASSAMAGVSLRSEVVAVACFGRAAFEWMWRNPQLPARGIPCETLAETESAFCAARCWWRLY